MKDLREKKKTETRARILAVAAEMFRRKGYAGATTSGIADLAGIAEGTIFNYFSSKAEILVSLFYRAFLREPYAFETDQAGDLTDLIARFLDYHLSPAREMDKALLREVLSIGYRSTREGAFIFAKMQDMDREIARGLGGYLSRLQEERVIRDDVDVEAFLEVGYAVVMYLFSRYVMLEELSYDDLMRQVREKLDILTRCLLSRLDGAAPARSRT